MNRLEYILEKIRLANMKLTPMFKVSHIVIHPELERNIFIDGLVEKSSNLEDVLDVSVILSKDIATSTIILGINY